MSKLKMRDPRNRSVNAPAVLVESREVVALFQQETGRNVPDDTSVIRNWYTIEATKEGWHRVEFQGLKYQCLLKANVAIVHGSSDEVTSSN